MGAEELAQQAADRVRDVIADAERRATEIVERAEAEAAEIRGRAESEAREKLERARQALAELVGDGPGAEAAATDRAPVSANAAAAEETAGPELEPAPEPGVSEPASDRGVSNGDGDSAARLVAMKLALDGQGREQIAAELESRFGSSERGALLDDVLARAGRPAS